MCTNRLCVRAHGRVRAIMSCSQTYRLALKDRQLATEGVERTVETLLVVSQLPQALSQFLIAPHVIKHQALYRTMPTEIRRFGFLPSSGKLQGGRLKVGPAGARRTYDVAFFPASTKFTVRPTREFISAFKVTTCVVHVPPIPHMRQTGRRTLHTNTGTGSWEWREGAARRWRCVTQERPEWDAGRGETRKRKREGAAERTGSTCLFAEDTSGSGEIR